MKNYSKLFNIILKKQKKGINMKKTILLTGGAGFIGSHLAEKFISLNYKVIVIDNFSSGKIENVEKIQNNENFLLINSDIRDFDKLEEVFKKYKPHIINHHAAQKSVPYSIEDPLSDISINCVGLINLIMLGCEYNIENFVYVSSGGALSKKLVGNEKSKEIDLPELVSPYAINKYSGEKYIEIYSKMFGFQYTILRYANIYGPRQIIDGESGVIPIFVENILNEKESTLMTYEDMPRGCTRDYLYIEDVVNINALITEKPVNDVINIGSGKEVCILDIYNTIQKIFKTNIKINIVGPRKGDIKRSVLDCGKVKQLLDWEYTVELEEGIELLRQYIDKK